MKTTLKDFQETAVRELAKNVRVAARNIEDELAAIVLSSPTGSGKTVTLCALLERLWQGAEDVSADPQARFLWLSDSPQLNEQSRDKFETHSDVFGAARRQIIESSFDQEVFESGKIYFLNTQKLSKDALLTKPGDNREFTIWQTVANTAKKFPGNFYLVIDEAHRGMTQTRALNEARTIVQKFILGDKEVGLPSVPLIIGMSATPERFQTLIAQTKRVKRDVEIPVADVIASGLLKESVVVSYPEGAEGNVDFTLLEKAVDDLVRYRARWAEYSGSQNEEKTVEPVLVVQVQDGSVSEISQTNLDQVVEVIDRRYYERTDTQPPTGFFAHCFQETHDLSFGGHNIRKIEPSRVQNADAVRVVFFKTALSTGWDCPRAEVMMSFRSAQDKTHIAQLVGRMVRTPLARRIEIDEWLNTVRLYLPHYNRATILEVVKKLEDPDADDGVGTSVVTEKEEKTYSRAPGSEEAFALLDSLPSYKIIGAPKKANTARLRTLARALVVDKFHDEAEGEAKDLIVEELWKVWGGFDDLLKLKARTFAQFDLRELNISYGTLKESKGAAQLVEMAPENIEHLFEWCGRKLTNGIHLDFDQKYYQEPEFDDDPLAIRLALYLVVKRDETMPHVEQVCGEKVSAWLQQFKAQINSLPEAKRKRYDAIRAQSRKPEKDVLRLPEILEGTKTSSDVAWPRHLFCDENGEYFAKFNSWEAPVIDKELKNKNVLFWLRNQPRKQWAFCVPYQLQSENKPCFPDFLFVRKEGNELICDIIDPHDPELTDSVEKAKGLAKFAEDHGYHSPFGRIELVAEIGGHLKRLNLQDDKTREAVKKVTAQSELVLLYSLA